MGSGGPIILKYPRGTLSHSKTSQWYYSLSCVRITACYISEVTTVSGIAFLGATGLVQGFNNRGSWFFEIFSQLGTNERPHNACSDGLSYIVTIET